MTFSTRRFGAVPLSRFAGRAAMGWVGAQAAVVAALVVTDEVKKRSRVQRSGFPRPGTFDSTIEGTETRIYTYGQDLYDDMLAAIRAAKERIVFETYIWKGDEVGQEFLDALNDAAERGVAVHVTYDQFANVVVPSSFYTFHPAVHVFAFPPVGPIVLSSPLAATGLTHRKLLVVDNETGFVGGYNIGSLYATQWRDTHLRLRGPAVYELGHSFARVWNPLATGQPTLHQVIPVSWVSPQRAINNIPAELVYPIRSIYLDAIHRAQDHIFLTTAYFVPDQRIMTALIEAARRGVDVRIIIPERSNHILADWVSRGFYSPLLAANITILLYQNAMIHAKTITIDGQWSFVGTANIDRLSLRFNYETGLATQSADFAINMEHVFATDSDNCRHLDAQEWATRHPAARFAEAALVPLRPLL